MNYLKKDFIKWKSGNKDIDDFIQEMQLKISYFNDIVFEWIPYNQFSNITKMDKTKNNLATAIWMGGPLKYCSNNQKYKRSPGLKVTLKYYENDLQKIINEV